jgi:polygalacturonase
MRLIHLKITLTFVSLFFIFQSHSQKKDISYYMAKAPFKMPEVIVPKFKNQVFDITKYGAIGDGKTLNTEAINKAIETCANAGGGVVEIPKGVWLTGPIELKSNVNIHTNRGTLVQFTKDRTQYPVFKPQGSGSFVVKSPIFGNNLENIALTGEGIFDGGGESWRPVKKQKVSEAQWSKITEQGVISSDGKVWWPSVEAMNGEAILKELKDKPDATADDYLKARDFNRPYMVMFNKCKNILIDSVGLKNSPKFVFYPTKCTNLTVSNAIVFNEEWAQNGDGIDISACKQVVIFNTLVSAGDDGICMKSSNGSNDTADAQLQNVIIAGCTVLKGHGGFVIGSNTDGGMKNIYVTDCVFNGTDIGIRVKSNVGRGGNVRDIFIDNIKMDNIIHEAVLFSTSYGDNTVGKASSLLTDPKNEKVPHFNNFHISNIVCSSAAIAMSIAGMNIQPTHHLYFENIEITAKNGVDITDANNIFFKGVKINSPSKFFKLTRTENIINDGTPVK